MPDPLPIPVLKPAPVHPDPAIGRTWVVPDPTTVILPAPQADGSHGGGS